MDTPYFLLSENILKENIESFKEALQKNWPNSQIAYSVKTNSLPWILEFMNNQNLFLEVVSDEEYELACLCNTEKEHIILNGPIKSADILNDAIRNDSIVNIDSQKDIDTIMGIDDGNAKNIGIRINIPPEAFKESDISFAEDGSRFGFSIENPEFEKMLEMLEEHFNSRAFGLHLHLNSLTRSLDVFRVIAGYARDLIQKYNLDPAFIDFGGGFSNGLDGKPNPEEYILCIKNELYDVIDIHKTRLYIEPGAALIGSAVDLYSTVIDTKDTLHARIVTTDASRIFLDPLWKKDRYHYSVVSDSKHEADSQIICGYTCMEYDRIMKLRNEKELKPGDVIIYHRIGAYTVTFGGMFIRSFPEVYVKGESGIKQIRKRISTKDYYIIQTNNDERT